MICSSVNHVRFIVRPQVGPDSNRRWKKIPWQVSITTVGHGKDAFKGVRHLVGEDYMLR